MNLISNNPFIRTTFQSVRNHHKEITITLRTDQLFNVQGLNQKYIHEKINECLKREQPFAPGLPHEEFTLHR